MKQKVYIVIKDCVYDYDVDKVVEPFGNLDEAVSCFNNIVDYCRSAAEDDDWIIDEDTPHSFAAYEDGYEAQNHAYVKLQISEINIK